MAVQVEHIHLSKKEPAEHSTGNLFGPSLGPHDATVTGGWSGRRRTAQHTILGTALVGVGTIVLADKLKVGAPVLTGAATGLGRTVTRSQSVTRARHRQPSDA